MDIEKSGAFIYRNARPLDLARWMYLFENGDRDSVLKILAAYQNEDGGFGHGLEPDCWTPDSSPVQTWTATEIIKETGLEDAEHPVIQVILKYLSSGMDFDGHTWANTVPSNNDAPHAPWWTYSPSHEVSYNPTACFTGFILKYAQPGSELYQTALRLLQEAYSFFKTNFPLESMHTVSCFVELYGYLRGGKAWGAVDPDEFRDLLNRQISRTLTRDTSVWAVEYVCKPSLFIDSKDSDFYAGCSELCDFECEFISDSQQADGTWAVTWVWSDYPEQWHISKNWWKSDLIIKNLKFFKAMRG